MRSCSHGSGPPGISRRQNKGRKAASGDTGSVRLLPVMGFPGTVCQLQIGEYGGKAGILWTAGIDAEADFSCAFPHVADTHLCKGDAVL